jgi:hypothetical protein
MKNELGLDHLECRGWRALQHHTLLVMMAMAFLQQLWVGGKRKGRARVGPRPSPSVPQVRRQLIIQLQRWFASRCPHCHAPVEADPP